MAKVIVESGACGFKTEIEAKSEDMQNVKLHITSDCPHIAKGANGLAEVDAFAEIFGKKLHETEVYKAVSPHLPHAACPVYAGILKAVECAAGLALPKDAVIKFE
jgi:hypothetical protein